MKHCKGTVTALRQHGGCVEVLIEGEAPGAFIIDNLCFGMIAANEGVDWIGRPVEYENTHMRFLEVSAVQPHRDAAPNPLRTSAIHK